MAPKLGNSCLLYPPPSLSRCIFALEPARSGENGAGVGVLLWPYMASGELLSRGEGAWLNGERLHCPESDSLGSCIANIDYKRLVGDLASQLVRCPPYRSQRNLGSSVLEWCWLATGRIQLYLHGGQKLWDFAAGYLILLEAGGAATSLSGLPLDCSLLRKRSVIAAVNEPLLKKWVAWIDANSEISQSTPY